MPETTYDYPNFSVTLYPFLCSLKNGRIVLHEHKSYKWLKPSEIESIDWSEADLTLIQKNIIFFKG